MRSTEIIAGCVDSSFSATIEVNSDLMRSKSFHKSSPHYPHLEFGDSTAPCVTNGNGEISPAFLLRAVSEAS